MTGSAATVRRGVQPSEMTLLVPVRGQKKGSNSVAQRILTVLTCDLHEKDVEAVESVAFSVQGTSYEMDLCEAHLKRFNDSLATFTAGARTGGHSVRGTRRTRRTSRRRGSGSGGPSSDTRVIREWALSQGHAVSAKGRIPAHIVEQYRAQS